MSLRVPAALRLIFVNRAVKYRSSSMAYGDYCVASRRRRAEGRRFDDRVLFAVFAQVSCVAFVAGAVTRAKVVNRNF
jgi:hypothetical protein